MERIGRTPDTVATYLDVIGKVSHQADPDEDGPWQLTPGRLSRWLDSRNYSVRTRSRTLSALRMFYAWAIDHGHVDRSPVSGIGLAKMPPGPDRAQVGDTWATALADFEVWMRAAGKAAGTISVYRQRLLTLAREHGNPWTITAHDVAVWLSRPGWGAESRRQSRGVAISFYTWAIRTGRHDHNPAADTTAVRLPRALPRPITRDGLREALGGADDRQRLILLLAALAGLRRAEIAGLRWDQITDQRIRVHGKGGHHRLVPIHPVLAAALSDERGRRQAGQAGDGFTGPGVAGSAYVFPHPDGDRPLTPPHLAKITRGCIPAGFTLHTLRHRFATDAYAVERDLRAVQELVGHAKPETTARYAAVPDGAKLTAVQGIGL
ncbi:tyrosine-type recombinase/integrase [Propionibacteriaceae bacterium Y1685]